MATKKKTSKRAAKKSVTSANKAKGRRYSAKERAEVLSHVDSINSEKGRGGITAAAAKFGVTPLTISAWMRSQGLPTRGSGPSKATPQDFRRLAELHEEILQAENRLSDLKRDYSTLKRKL